MKTPKERMAEIADTFMAGMAGTRDEKGQAQALEYMAKHLDEFMQLGNQLYGNPKIDLVKKGKKK